MATEVATSGLPLGGVVGVVTHHSGFTQATFGEVPEKVLVPSAPVIDSMAAPDQSAGILALSITLPTTDTDSDALAQSEIVKIRMHHSTSSGVTTNDSYVDFPPGVTLQWTPGDVVTHYVAVRVQDTHDHWSALSNEESAAANGGTSPEYDGLWAHRLNDEAVWTEDSPDTNSIAWSDVVLYWKANAYTIAAGNTDKKYLWWDYDVSTTTFQSSDTKPTLTYQDVLVATNDAGKLYLTMYSPMVIADFIRAGLLESTNYAAAIGSQFDLDNGTLILGGSDEAGAVLTGDGDLSLGGTVFQFTAADLTLIMQGTYKTSGTGVGLFIYGSTDITNPNTLIAYDAVGKRVSISDEEIEIYKFVGGTPTSMTIFPSTVSTAAHIGNTDVFVDNSLIVGRATDPTTDDKLHVTGTGLFTSTVVVGDHGESTTPSVVNVLFYTAGNLPAANTTPRGTFAVQVPA
jgi:hypothetical protein